MNVAFTVKEEIKQVAEYMLAYVEKNIPNFKKITNSPAVPEIIRRKISLSKNLMKHNDYPAALQELKGVFLLVRAVVGK